MKLKFLSLFSLMALTLSILTGCATTSPTSETGTTSEGTTETSAETATDTSNEAVPVGSLAFNNAAWNYDADNDVYWQIGVQYVTNPETTEYETLGIYVPGVYLTATANGDGTYTATPNAAGTLNGFTAQTAPLVFPVNTPGYSAQAAPTAYSYDSVASYLQAGFIYVHAGMRGRDNGYDASGALSYSGGAPWGVTDLKAAVRYVRYNASVLPGNPESVFVFGMSGGGAQSSIIGASGDSELYFPYLEALGAAMTDANGNALSDAVTGVMAWCPITSLDYADAAYEWNMGQYATDGTRADGTWTSALSKDLATAYAEYINALGITDENGNVLVLETSESGIYAAGSYYDYLMKVVETSLNNFLADTTFPYTASAGGFGGLPGGGPNDGGTPPSGELPSGGALGGNAPSGNSGSSEATTYATVQDYIASLNADVAWVTYNADTNTATITSLADFATYAKTPSKSVAAFDDLNRSQAENNVFGNDESDSLHFDVVLANLLAQNQATYATFTDWDASYINAYATDLKALDKLGNGIAYRQNMYNPMYYLLPSYEGYETANVATYWRIRTGLEQGDTASTVEVNLALALENYASVANVDFATVWAQGHTMAERIGDSTTNFIAWVVEMTQK